MSSMIAVPPTIEAAQEAIGEIDRLLSLKQWHRAAIVAAFVEPQRNGGDRRSANHKPASGLFTPNEFAALRITGLRSGSTVRRYVEAWLSTGMPRPQPGQKVFLPDRAFVQEVSA